MLNTRSNIAVLPLLRRARITVEVVSRFGIRSKN